MEKMEISLPLELVNRIDEVVELLDYCSREEFIICALNRYADKLRSPNMKSL